jgi:hypothetical protein
MEDNYKMTKTAMKNLLGEVLNPFGPIGIEKAQLLADDLFGERQVVTPDQLDWEALSPSETGLVASLVDSAEPITAEFFKIPPDVRSRLYAMACTMNLARR